MKVNSGKLGGRRFILLLGIALFACQCSELPNSESYNEAESRKSADVKKSKLKSSRAKPSKEKPKLYNYQEPHLDIKLFDPEKTQLLAKNKTELVHVLVEIASEEITEVDMRTKALGVALRIDPVNKRAFIANEMLSKGESPKSFPEIKGDHKTVIDRLWSFADELANGKEASEDDIILAVYLMALFTEIETDNMDRAYEFSLFTKEKKVQPEWDTIIYGSKPRVVRVGNVKNLVKLQAKVKGLLVQSLEANTFAGKASQMNATAVKNSSRHEMKVSFDQSVGNDMNTALDKVIRYLRLKHESLPTGYDVKISFEEQYIPKDGPSAAVACALLLDSLIKGNELDPDIAVTGDMNADGTVQPVGGITGKLRGAERRDCNVIAIPVSNKRVIRDLLITNGPTMLTRIQIFSIETFEDALQLAMAHDKRDPAIKESIDLFAEIQAVLNRAGGENFLSNSHVRTRLEKCLELTPNHLSAKLLLDASMGRVSKKLSLTGSLENIDRTAEPLLRALRQRKFDISDPLAENEYANAASALRRLRPILDDRTIKCVDAIINYSLLMQRYSANRPKSPTGLRKLADEIRSAGNTINQEYDTLSNRVDVKEETMR